MAVYSLVERGWKFAHEVRDLSQVPHLLLSIGQNRKHIFQGNIWHASAKHPLLARAVGHALGTSQSHLKRYLLFCEFLWAELRRDLGKDPVQGWNFCPTLGPIYLFQEQMDGQGRAERDRRGRTCLGEEFPVDGHFMFTTGGTRYAATRAWGWKKGFLPVALGAIATQRAEAQSVAQPEPQPGTPAPEAPSAPPPEAPSSSAAQQRVAQLQETPSAATQPAANQVEVPPLETTITPEGLERIMAVATGQSWYEGLTRAEVEIFTVQGLREATRREGYLSCLFCKSRKRQQLLFQGTNEVRNHFEGNHERPEATEAVSSAVAEEIGQAMAVVEQTMDKAGGRELGQRAERGEKDKTWKDVFYFKVKGVYFLKVCVEGGGGAPAVATVRWASGQSRMCEIAWLQRQRCSPRHPPSQRCWTQLCAPPAKSVTSSAG